MLSLKFGSNFGLNVGLNVGREASFDKKPILIFIRMGFSDLENDLCDHDRGWG
jgi:hypothetical protein